MAYPTPFHLPEHKEKESAKHIKTRHALEGTFSKKSMFKHNHPLVEEALHEILAASKKAKKGGRRRSSGGEGGLFSTGGNPLAGSSGRNPLI